MPATKKWEDYTKKEKRESIKNHFAFEIINAIKNNKSPILKRATYQELRGIDSDGKINNSNVAYNGFNGIAYEGLNMLMLDTAKNVNKFKSNIWLDGKQAMMLGVKAEALKDMKGISVQKIRTIDYEPQYELDDKGEKIPIMDEATNKQKLSINGKPLFKRKMEKIQVFENNKPVFEKDGITPKYKLDKDGKPLERFAPDIPKPFYTKNKDGKIEWIKEAILETTKVYNIEQLIPTIQNEKQHEYFINHLKTLEKMPKHFNAFNKDKKDLYNEAGILTNIAEIRLEELQTIKGKNGEDYGLNDNTIKAINRYFYARNNNADFSYPLQRQTAQERANANLERNIRTIASNLYLNHKQNPSVAKEVANIANDLKNKQTIENDIVKNTIEAIKDNTKAPQAKKQVKQKTKNNTMSM